MLKPSNTPLLVVFACVLFFSACAQKHPALYPNDYLEHVGDEVAQADIDDCMRLAADHGTESDSGERVAKRTVGGAAVGGAVGAAVGAVTGNIGRGAAIGAAGGAAGGFTRGLLRSREPDPVFRRFVEIGDVVDYVDLLLLLNLSSALDMPDVEIPS